MDIVRTLVDGDAAEVAMVDNVLRARASELADLGWLITDEAIESVRLGWTKDVDLSADPGRHCLLIPKPDAVRDEMTGLLGGDESPVGCTWARPPTGPN